MYAGGIFCEMCPDGRAYVQINKKRKFSRKNETEANRIRWTTTSGDYD